MVTVSSIPDVLRFSSLQARSTEIRQELSDAQLELTTGFRSTKKTIQQLNGRLGDAQLLRREINQFDRKNQSFALGLGRASIVQNSLSLILESVGSIPEDLRSASLRGDRNRIEVTALEAQSSVETVFGALNAQYGRRFLFAGDQTDRAPIVNSEQLLADVAAIVSGAATAADADTALDTYFGPGGTFETILYRGGAGEAATVELSENERVGVETKADEQAFRDILRGLAVSAAASSTSFADDSERDVLLQAASTSLVDGIEGVSVLIAETGLTENRIASAQARLAAEEAIITDAYLELVGEDPFVAAGRVQELEVQLQTTFTVTARLSRLSFTNFINS
ncbi:MAG: flagellin [Pseudomonadota bacterium]